MGGALSVNGLADTMFRERFTLIPFANRIFRLPSTSVDGSESGGGVRVGDRRLDFGGSVIYHY